MRTQFELPASEFRSLCTMLGYRRKTVIVQPTLSVTLQELNWCGGTKNVYSAVDIETGHAVTPNLGAPHPMDNENEGARVGMRPGTLIVRTGTFIGKPARMIIYAHPDNVPQLLPKEIA